jgi:hypothetical protein
MLTLATCGRSILRLKYHLNIPCLEDLYADPNICYAGRKEKLAHSLEEKTPDA